MVSFQSAYGIGLVCGFFCRRFFSPVLIFFIYWFWVYRSFTDDPDGIDYKFLLPLAMLSGTFIGYATSAMVNLKRLLFWKSFQLFGCWLLIAAVEFSLLIGSLLIADYESTFVLPLNYFLTLILYVVILLMFYFGTNKMTIWKTQIGTNFITNDRAALYFYILLGTFGISSILLFLIIGWSAPAASQRWAWLGTVGLHVLFYCLLWRLTVSATLAAAESSNARATRELTEQKGAELLGAVLSGGGGGKKPPRSLLPRPPPSSSRGGGDDDDTAELIQPPSARELV